MTPPVGDADVFLGLLWDMTKTREKPLWWCLIDEEKERFQERVLRVAADREIARLHEYDELVADLRSSRG